MRAPTGGVDPRFLGIQFHFSDPSSFRWFLDCYTNTSARKIKKDKNYVTKIIGSTMVEHELRHFWDSMLSPYYSSLLRKKISSYIHYAQLLPYLASLAVSSGTNVFTVPLCRWLEMSSDDRRAFGPRAKFLLGEGEDVQTAPLPIIPNLVQTPIPESYAWFPIPDTAIKEFARKVGVEWNGSTEEFTANIEFYLTMIKDAYDTVDFWSTGPRVRGGVNVSPWEISEVSAIMVQFVAAAELYSQKVADDLFRSLDAEKDTIYYGSVGNRE